MSDTGIAVIGIACRLPGASSPQEFWRNLREGRESIRRFTEEEMRAAGIDPKIFGDPRYVPAKGVLEGADSFDAGFFGISPREAALMDPQQRVFLETAWWALEDAGYEPRHYRGAIGVFAGSIMSIYLLRNLVPNRQVIEAAGHFQLAVGNDPTFLATTTSYQLDLRGPSVSVGTACSTSLVAVHLACQSLLAYESDMALAGGVSIHLPLAGGYRYEDGGVLSPDGRCRAFDASAQGTVSSDGAGVVVLRRLADAIADGDMIHAVIRGSAMNNDGRMKVGYTAPSARGEAQVIAEAMSMAGFAPETISMIEAHGAGTLLGDPIEVSALVDAFGECGGKRAFCALGSVKSNIGHVDAAAGIAGLIKTVLAVEHREIPPTLHFERANPQVDFAETPFYVNDRLRTVDGPFRAGVSSFGIGGTNVHVVLESAGTVAAPPPEPKAAAPIPVLLNISARTPAALEMASDRLADHLERHDLDLTDVAFTLRRGRRAFAHRRTIVAADRPSAVAALRARDGVTGVSSTRPAVAFMFPGLGDHYSGMGWELYCTERVFRETVDRCAERLQLSRDIRDFLYPSRDWRNPKLESVASGSGVDLRAMLGRKKEQPADRTELAQPAIFVTEVALAQLMRSWGIEPEAMIGHSIGEFAAAHLAGVLSLDDALTLVAARARLIESVAHGAMLAVPLTEEELRPLLPDGVSLGAINAARLCVASGESDPIASLAETLAARGISCQRLRSTHAYHSRMMEPLVEPLTEVLRRVRLDAPRIPYVSCITGTWIREAEATDPEYWARHLCRTVRFHEGLATLLGDPQRVLVEVGPGQGLTAHAIAERSRVEARENAIVPLMRWSYGLQSELAVLLHGVGQLWCNGIAFDFEHAGRRVPLPTYPFERQRYWIEPAASEEPIANGRREDVGEWFYLPSWKPSLRPRSRVEGKWFAPASLANTLRARGVEIVDDLAEADRIVQVGGDYDQAIALVQHVGAREATLYFIVEDESPENAMLRAPVMVAPQEHPGLTCRLIDVAPLRGARIAEGGGVPLLDELLSDASEPFVAYRDGARFVLSYEPVRIEAPATPPFRKNGTYLITGGAGGVGTILANHLREKYDARVIVTSRSTGVDVSDSAAMRRALDTIDRLHGVIHAAGAVGIETFREIREAAPSDAEAQFIAKVRGVRVLEELLAGRDLDFVLLMSSLSAILGGLGFTAYSAANAFMDSFARKKNREGKTRWISVDWDSWRVMNAKPVIAGFGATVDGFVMEPHEGVDALERILAEPGLAQVVVSTGDLDQRLRMWVGRRGLPDLAQGPRHERPSLGTAYEAPRGELESELAEIWQELFGVAQVGVHDNFFELGGHSLLATQLNARLSQRLHVDMSLATLLQAPTIARLAVAIVSHQAEAADAELLQELIEELVDE